ncbi:MAG: hypothetical protein WD872_14230 [Pirellulaceae bacterium]
MFTFKTQQPILEVQNRLRRMMDLTVPNLPAGLNTSRAEDRCNRTLPALLCPWERGGPVSEDSAFVVTSDLSSQGVGLILRQPFRAERVLLAFWLNAKAMEAPWYFLGRAQSLRKLGGGYWTLGVELAECPTAADAGKLATLKPLVNKLRPARSATA